MRVVFLHGMEFRVVPGMGSIVWVIVHGYKLTMRYVMTLVGCR